MLEALLIALVALLVVVGVLAIAWSVYVAVTAARVIRAARRGVSRSFPDPF